MQVESYENNNNKSLPNTITLNVCCHNLCQYICTFPENMTYSLSEGITV